MFVEPVVKELTFEDALSNGWLRRCRLCGKLSIVDVEDPDSYPTNNTFSSVEDVCYCPNCGGLGIDVAEEPLTDSSLKQEFEEVL